MKNSRKKILFILLVSLALMALGGCSGVIGGGTSLRMYIPDPAGDSVASGGRYVDGSAFEANVLVAQQDKAYSYNNFDTVAAGTSYYVSNLFPDTYIIGVALLDNFDDMVNLRLLEYDMKPGLNDIPLELGPGIEILAVNGLPIENPFQPEGYTARFGTDKIILGGLRTGSDLIEYLASDGTSTGQIITNGVPGGLPIPSPWTIDDPSESGVEITTTSAGPLNDTFTFTIILE